ncbi:MAG: hypothetical protein Q8P67_20555 [archaeon]|nr:hypothetical protein [archaeon]
MSLNQWLQVHPDFFEAHLVGRHFVFWQWSGEQCQDDSSVRLYGEVDGLECASSCQQPLHNLRMAMQTRHV